MKAAIVAAVVCILQAGSALHCYDCPRGDPAEGGCNQVSECSGIDLDFVRAFISSSLPGTAPPDPRTPLKPVCFTQLIMTGEVAMGGRACSFLDARLTCPGLAAVAKGRGGQLLNCSTCATDFCNDQPLPTAQLNTLRTVPLPPITTPLPFSPSHVTPELPSPHRGSSGIVFPGPDTGSVPGVEPSPVTQEPQRGGATHQQKPSAGRMNSSPGGPRTSLLLTAAAITALMVHSRPARL